MNARLLIAAALLPGSLFAAGQTLETAYRTNGPVVQGIFESAREVLQHSSAVLQRGRNEVAYGTVISADGYILTKASEIGDGAGLSILVDHDTYPAPKLIAIEPEWDVALFKIEATGLVPVRYSPEVDPQRGTWVIANGATTLLKRRPQVGIISANSREIPPAGGPVVGVELEEKSDRLVVKEVFDKTGAKEAGVLAGDILAEAGGKPLKIQQDLAEVVEQHRVGEELPIVIEREGKKMDLKIKLAGRVDVFGEELTRNDQMSGLFSTRRSGFPRVIQHDVIANKKTIGGPLLDLDGNCLGMNIARVDRCETYAIPAAELKILAERMMAAAASAAATNK